MHFNFEESCREEIGVTLSWHSPNCLLALESLLWGAGGHADSEPLQVSWGC